MNRHPFRWGSAVFGLGFAGIVTAWAVLALDLLDVDTAGVVVATTLIVLGVLGITGTVIASRRSSRPPRAEADAPDHADDTMDPETAPDGTEEVPDGHEEAPTQR